MNPLDWIMGKIGYGRKASGDRRRSYAAAKTDRLVVGWPTTPTSGDRELRDALTELRARSQDLCRNNDYAKRFVELCRTNIVGPQGILMQNKATMAKDPLALDAVANREIEDAWGRWGRIGRCTADGCLSWIDAQALFVSSLVVDGEVLIRIVRDREAPFQIQFLEADQLDVSRNEVLSGGNEIRMGVEVSPFGKPIAYWILDRHPGEIGVFGTGSSTSKRVPASEIIHQFVKTRPSNTRGVPWMHTAMLHLKMLGGYEEAELVAARVSACKMGVIETATGDEYGADAGTEAGTGAKLTSAEPGIFDELAVGQKMSMFDPTHPAGNFDPFVKSVLRGVAAGLGVSYHSLSGDLTDVNYSSIRSGTLEMRDQWRILQRFVIDHFCQPVFDAWLTSYLMDDGRRIGLSAYDRVNRPMWLVRGWEWVDPLKDVNASIAAIKAGLTTHTIELSRQGLDFEEVLDQLAFERELAKSKGIDLGQGITGTEDMAGGYKSEADQESTAVT
jgi:lambda family phage portal protein